MCVCVSVFFRKPLLSLHPTTTTSHSLLLYCGNQRHAMRITVTSNWHLTINLLACVIFDPGHCGEV